MNTPAISYSASCNKCGAPLYQVRGTCKCGYCGSVNLITENGKTIVWKNSPRAESGQQEQKAWKDMESGEKAAVIFTAVALVLFGAALLHRDYKRKQ